jgi:hypothetical protein
MLEEGEAEEAEVGPDAQDKKIRLPHTTPLMVLTFET